MFKVDCPICGRDTDDLYEKESMCHKCRILISFTKEDSCPDCGAVTYIYNDPADDNSMGTYCGKSHKTIENQYMDREDFIESEGPDYYICKKQEVL